jgi:flagellar biosynthetic protein FlhB
VAEDLGEKTEDATPKRRQESREKGQVARSQDLGGALLLVVGTMTIAAAAYWMLSEATGAIRLALDGRMIGDPLDPTATREFAYFIGAAAIRISAPVLLITWVAGVMSQFIQVGWLFSPQAIQPKLSKLDPIKGFQRVFGLSALVKAALDTLKVLVIAVVSIGTIMQHHDQIVVMPYMALLEALATAGMLMLDLAIRALIVLLLLGVIDFTYQRWKHSQDLKMTKQQVKDELKQTEGDPEVKRRRIKMQQQVAMHRVSAAVPKADVIVTNPEHISIALQYDAEQMNAPTVVAKGADHLALRIRQIAIKHGIPIVERKPLARALYKQVEVGQEVPPDLYAAVAEVLAYVYRLSGRMAG